ncbi:MAG: NAD-dependent epimerase/dehydratase family protein, partial [Candidatus Poseidoniales archaeon]|nr:NAD-dependent epimerase/dehydratase family protein [Candidatus Poseidoniales archaeon]
DILGQNNLVSMVYHMGAESNTKCGDGKYLMQNNYQYTCNIMDICASHRLELVYASSAAVYGDQTKQWGSFDASSDDYVPLNYYALSKLQADKYARKFASNGQLKIIGLRYFNVISDGEFEQHKDGMKSPLCWMNEQYEAFGGVELFRGSEEFERDFIHIDEVIKTTMNAMTQGRTGIYNVGMGATKSFYDLATEVLDGQSEHIKWIDMPEDVAQGYQTYTKADMSNACFGIPDGSGKPN